ncbi:MAG: hypothetical protein ACFFAN_11515 [Promethearchaeota archaeon]
MPKQATQLCQECQEGDESEIRSGRIPLNLIEIERNSQFSRYPGKEAPRF